MAVAVAAGGQRWTPSYRDDVDRRPTLANTEERKGEEKTRDQRKKKTKLKTNPYYTPQQFSIPQMLDLEGHQSL